MSDKIVNIADKLKQKLNKEQEIPEYYKRFLQCQQNEKLNGKCNCEVCNIKIMMADSLVRLAQEMFDDYSKSYKVNLYYGDLLECLVIATLKVKSHCEKEDT